MSKLETEPAEEQQLEAIVDSTLNERVENQEHTENNSLFRRVSDSFYSYDSQYFKPRKFERWKDGLLYKLLGVHIFKKIVPTCGEYINKLRGEHPIANAKTKEEGLKNWERNTRGFETVHLAVALGYLGYIGERLISGNRLAYVAGAIIVNVLFNFYPIMLQRYNRAKIYNALENQKINPESQEGEK